MVMMVEPAIQRPCPWAGDDPLYVAYHDDEWGVPVYDDRRLFEFLILEGAQAGLSWITVLRKREAYRQAFAQFDPEQVARFDDQDQARLLANPGLVRNRRKIASAITNAQAFLAVQAEFGSFAAFLWPFVGGHPRHNTWQDFSQVPTQTAESQALSRALLRRGFKFVGPTICYAFMQAVGMVNDHLCSCPRHQAVRATATSL